MDEALMNPRPGAHEALVMTAQSPALETWNHPASHWLIQHKLSLTKLPGNVHGEDIVVDAVLRPQPKELHETTCKVCGLVPARMTLRSRTTKFAAATDVYLC